MTLSNPLSCRKAPINECVSQENGKQSLTSGTSIFSLILPWCGLQGGFSAHGLSFSLLTSGPGKALDKLKLMGQQIHCYEEHHLNHRWCSRLRQGHLLPRQSPGKAGDSMPSMWPQPSRHQWSASGECVCLYQGGCPLSLHVMGDWRLPLPSAPKPLKST